MPKREKAPDRYAAGVAEFGGETEQEGKRQVMSHQQPYPHDNQGKTDHQGHPGNHPVEKGAAESDDAAHRAEQQGKSRSDDSREPRCLQHPAQRRLPVKAVIIDTEIEAEIDRQHRKTAGVHRRDHAGAEGIAKWQIGRHLTEPPADQYLYFHISSIMYMSVGNRKWARSRPYPCRKPPILYCISDGK